MNPRTWYVNDRAYRAYRVDRRRGGEWAAHTWCDCTVLPHLHWHRAATATTERGLRGLLGRRSS